MASVIACSYFVFGIQIIEAMPQIDKQMMTGLKEERVDILFPLESYERLNEILSNFRTIHKDKVEYINIYQVGSVLHVEYTECRQDKKEKDDCQNLYAKKDSMTGSFDVNSGLIKIKKNDYVKKGDLPVEDILVSTQDETKTIPVKGHVYAYTFNQYETSVKSVNQDRGEVFYQLLLSIRAKLPTDAVTGKENALQMTKTHSKITLKVYYTLLEDITIRREENEGNH